MSLAIITAVLERIPQLAGLPRKALDTIARTGNLHKFPAGQVVFRRGESAECIYIVLLGGLTLYKNALCLGEAVSEVGPGSVLGPVTFLSGGQWPVSGQTFAETLLFSFGLATFSQVDQVSSTAASELRLRLRQADALVKQNTAALPDEQSLPPELFWRSYTCPCCASTVYSCAVRSKAQRVASVEQDFYIHYEGHNPLYYAAIVCDACGYAFDEADREPLRPAVKESVLPRLANQPRCGYAGVRTLEKAIDAYHRVMYCQGIAERGPAIRANSCLKLAWIYRSAGDREMENLWLKQARQFFLEVYEKGQATGTKQELRLMYLLGEIHYRLEDYQQAVYWFSQITNHPGYKQFPQYARLARQRWQEIRYLLGEMKKQNSEAGSETQTEK
ncbi:MAG: DUF2225 domain-containing protein [Bacillota bacterium]|uniref:DUF2225 domain-containing protein n=1 Tax=Desulfurispora thermophila TaxID=265470 RepID=UPI00036787D8|nr:DUF2225 domain-containing protein [Desulfurispora thermophila]